MSTTSATSSGIALNGGRRLEVRDVSGGPGTLATVTGEPVIYQHPYLVADRHGEFTETMLPGVAPHLLHSADCRFLVNHSGLPLARSSASNADGQSDRVAVFGDRGHADALSEGFGHSIQSGSGYGSPRPKLRLRCKTRESLPQPRIPLPPLPPPPHDLALHRISAYRLPIPLQKINGRSKRDMVPIGSPKREAAPPKRGRLNISKLGVATRGIPPLHSRCIAVDES
jgi:hypothetical protein